MLYNENNRRGKDLQRRIAQNKEESRHLAGPRAPSPFTSSSIAPTPRSGSPSRLNGRDASLAMSQKALEDSYMLLGGRVRDI
jgi:hypothetical protein